jgi:LPS O-antigen subunit length determinant protein (WzzB/FepE family)
MEKHEEYYEDEVDLMEYLEVLWKKKWLIIIPTFILVVLAGVVSFLLPEVWRVESIILPSKFIVQTEQGSFGEVVVVPAKQIAGKINEKSYNQLIASELNLDVREFPELKAELLRDTNLVKISSRNQDVKKMKAIHLALFRHVKREIDKNVDIEIKNIDSQIKGQEINKKKLEDEIDALKSKLDIVIKRKEEIENSLVEIRGKIELLEQEQNENLKKENRSSSETLGMLLYSNEIQQSLQYLNNLNESLSQKKIEEEDIKIRIEEIQGNIEQTNNQINNLNEKKGRIDYALLSKEPTSSLGPVAPNKKLNVIIAGFIGLFLFTILAFFLEYIQKNKRTQPNKPNKRD